MNLLTLFQRYLLSVNELISGSKKSYVSYLKGLIEKVLDSEVKTVFPASDGFESTLLSLDKKKQEQFLLLFDSRLSEMLKGKPITGPLKTLSNYRSAYRKLLEMYYSDGIPSNRGGQNRAAIASSVSRTYKAVSNKLFDKSDLNRVYLSRLKTQDRRYAMISLPIRLIWSLARQHGESKTLKAIMLRTLDNMKYFVDDSGSALRHRDVKNLDFSKPCIIVNGKYKLFTPTAKASFAEFKGSMRDVSIDHIVSLENLLNNQAAISAYPRLKELSDGFVSFLNKNGIKGITSKASTEYFQTHGNRYDQAFVTGLVNEMAILFDKMEFQAMQTRLNSSKNKNAW